MAGHRAIIGKSRFEREAEQSTLGCMGGIAVLIAIGFLIGFYSHMSATWHLDHEGVNTEGKLVSVLIARGFRQATVTYSVDGKRHGHTGGHYYRKEYLGETVIVRYFSSDPDQAEIFGSGDHTLWQIVLVAGVLLPGAFAVAAVFKYRSLSVDEMQPILVVPDSELEGPAWATMSYQKARLTRGQKGAPPVSTADEPPTHGEVATLKDPPEDVVLNPLPSDTTV